MSDEMELEPGAGGDSPVERKRPAELLEEYRQRQIPEKFRMIRIDRHAIRLRDLEYEVSADTARLEGGALLRPLCGARTDRFFKGAPAPTFQTFVKSFYGHDATRQIRGPEEGRRIFAMLAERGIGRGQFFAALGGRGRFAELCQHLEIADRAGELHEVHMARFNLGLSHEVLSIFDRIAEFVFECHLDLRRREDKQVLRALKEQFALYEDDRINRLRFVFESLAAWWSSSQAPENAKRRIVIAINHANLFFERDHRTKNLQAQQLFELLISENFDKTPVDLLLLMDEERLPEAFLSNHGEDEQPPEASLSNHGEDEQLPGHDGKNAGFSLIIPPDYPQKLVRETDVRIERSKVFSGKTRVAERKVKGLQDSIVPYPGGKYFHVLRRMRPEVFGLRFFPRASMILAREALKEKFPGAAKPLLATGRLRHLGSFRHMRWFQHEIRKLFRTNMEGALNNLQIGTHQPERDTDYSTDRLARIGMIWSILFDVALQDKRFFAAYKEIVSKGDKLIYGEYSGFPYPLLAYTVAEAKAVLDREPAAGGVYNAFVANEENAGKVVGSIDGDAIFEAVRSVVGDTLDVGPPETSAGRVDWIEHADRVVKRKYRKIRQITGRHRFATTLIFASVEDILEIERRVVAARNKDELAKDRDLELDLAMGTNRRTGDLHGWPYDHDIPDGYKDGGRATPQTEMFSETSAIVRGFLEAIELRTAGLHPQAREDIVIDEVLHMLRSHHSSRSRWPFNPAMSMLHYGRLVGDDKPARELLDAEKNFASVLDEASGKLISDLCEVILLHLALIGQPVESGTLAACPEIADVVRQVREECEERKAEKEMKFRRRFILNACLDLLVRRCLVFRVIPKSSGKEELSMVEERFAMHKSLRRYFFKRFDTPLVDYMDVDQLTVSLYASQPNDLPRPGIRAQRRIEKLLKSLTEFEQLGVEDGNNQHRKMCNLRAANGVVRSIYSIGAVCRINSNSSRTAGWPKKGYLETHRQIVRWMLRQAVRSAPEAADAPFYPEEVVWLFNEAGVISIVQGKLNDATPLLRQARSITRQFIEPLGPGPLSNRVELNLCICDIEQGRARDAEIILKRLMRNKDEHRSLRLMARGYLGLIEHLRGNDRKARRRYEKAEAGLAEIGRFRSASIFAQHHADLCRSLGPPYWDQARDLVTRAINYASNGAHEDIRHIANISKLKLDIAQGEVSATERDVRLQSVETYAKIVGVPRLRYEASGVRALTMLKNGDARSAHAEAFKGLKIANQHGLRLRTISSSLQLAEALMIVDPANKNRLLQRTMRIAGEAEFFTARDSAEALLGP